MSTSLPARTDEEVLARARDGVGSSRFNSLFAGERSDYQSDEAADLAFCGYLAFQTSDPDQIVRIWQQSKRWKARRKTYPMYAAATAGAALRNRAAYVDPTGRHGPQGRIETNGHGNGQVESRTSAPPPPPNYPPTPAAGPDGKQKRRASELREQRIDWLVHPWIPRGELTFVVGPPACGKSTLLAWLMSVATSTVCLPGHEENAERMLLPRIKAHGADLDKVLLLEGNHWSVPSSRRALVAEVLEAKADLVLIDPVDSYIDDGLGENNAQTVRQALEALAYVANATNAAVVAVRHPGKNPDNPCPGSRAWRAVPRMIIQLATDLRTPPRAFLHLLKDSLASGAPDTYFSLAGDEPEQPKRFRFGEAVRAAESEIARMVGDRAERKKLDVACDFLRGVLSEGEQEAGWVLKSAQGLGLSPGTCYLAADRLGITRRRVGGGKTVQHFWDPPGEWPADQN